MLRAAAEAVATFAEGGYFTVAEGILYPFMLDLFVAACEPHGIDVNYAVLRAPIGRGAAAGAGSQGSSRRTPGRWRTRPWSTTCGPSSRATVSRSATGSTPVRAAPAEVAEEIDRRMRAGEFRL